MAETTSTDVVQTTEARRPPVNDHKPKAKKSKAANAKAIAKGESIEVEHNGKTWTIDGAALNDFELLEDLDAIDSGNYGRLPKVLRRMLGDEYKNLLDTLRDDKGIVRVEEGAEFFYAVIRQGNPNL